MSIDSSDLASLALSSLGFFTVPEETIAPELKSYSYVIEPKFLASEAFVERLYNKIGCLIGPQKQMTSLQKSKIQVVSLTTLGVLTTALLSTQVANLTGAAWLMPITALAISAIGIYKLVQYYSLYDLEDNLVRVKLQNQIQKWDFSKIATTFSVDELIGYDLLKEKLGFFTTAQKAYAYSNLKTLYQDFISLENLRSKDLSKIQEIYRIGTRKIENWIQGCRASSRSINWARLDRRREGGDASQDMIMMANRVISHTLERKYDELKQPWQQWRSYETLSIKQAYDKGETQLNRFYEEVTEGMAIPPA